MARAVLEAQEQKKGKEAEIQNLKAELQKIPEEKSSGIFHYSSKHLTISCTPSQNPFL